MIFGCQLSYRRWVAPLKDMMEQGLEIRVIEEEEKPFGCITFSAARDQAFAGWGEIVSFHLLLEARGKGYGRLLIQDAVRQLKEKGLFKNLPMGFGEKRKSKKIL